MQRSVAENIFFTVTCVSVFTCVIRSDYNFAMGLLSYYMIKNLGNKSESEFKKVARTVSATPTINYMTLHGSAIFQKALIGQAVLKASIRLGLLTLCCYALLLGGVLVSADHYNGRAVDPRHEGGLGRQAPQKRQRLEGFRERSLHHPLPVVREHRA